MRVGLVQTRSYFLQTRHKRAGRLATTAASSRRTFNNGLPLASGQAGASRGANDGMHEAEEEAGPMSRRLAEMTEETILAGGSSGAKNVEDAGFSEELKKQLESRIADSAFRRQNQRALTEAEIPSSAGKGSRDQANARPWTGAESLQDSALRMLDDSHKRLRGFRAPRVPQPNNLHLGPKKPTSTVERLANARDRTSIYAAALSNEMSDQERDQMRKELKERFSPAARPMPTTLQGLTSLANERIEDAIARGQFKNIPRGKGKNVERDYNASSPFLDTTEYFMNKIIQKQEIVPPWIEKQQELVKSVASFRGRLRNNWKRHAARMIASKGGSLESQIERAQAYAVAEERVNPMQTKVENFGKINSQGNVSNVTVQETAAAATAAVIPTTASSSAGQVEAAASVITITEIPAGAAAAAAAAGQDGDRATPSSPIPVVPRSEPPPAMLLRPFRDPTWESAEHSYHTLALATLNSLTRSYNLMAPRLAQKPYLNLARELARCYAEVAPSLPEEIRLRAQTPRAAHPAKGREGQGRGGNGGAAAAAGGVLGAKWTGHEVTRFRDEDLSVKGYGLRQLWRDFFARKA